MACVTSCLSPVVREVSQLASEVNDQFSLSLRVAYLYRAIAYFFHIPQMLTGTWLGLCSCLAAGVFPIDGNLSQIMLSASEKVVALVYTGIFGALYPEVPIRNFSSIVEKLMQACIIDPARELVESETWFKVHIVSRLIYAFGAAAAVTARIGLLPIGAVAAVYSLIPFAPGKEIFAQTAFEELQFLGIVKDVLFCATKFINPRAQIYYNGVIP